MCSKYEPADTIGDRGAVNITGRGAAAMLCGTASTASVGASVVGVFSTSFSPLIVGFVESVSVAPDSDSELSLAAIATFALAMAGSVTSETSFNLLALIFRTPSTFLYLSARTPTEKPSRSCVLASTSASFPALV